MLSGRDTSGLPRSSNFSSSCRFPTSLGKVSSWLPSTASSVSWPSRAISRGNVRSAFPETRSSWSRSNSRTGDGKASKSLSSSHSVRRLRNRENSSGSVFSLFRPRFRSASLGKSPNTPIPLTSSIPLSYSDSVCSSARRGRKRGWQSRRTLPLKSAARRPVATSRASTSPRAPLIHLSGSPPACDCRER